MDNSNTVPREAPDPIQHIIDSGSSIIALAVEWGFKTTDSVYRLKRFEYVPPAAVAQKMAESFGPEWTAGDVINHWLERVQTRAQEMEARAS